MTIKKINQIRITAKSECFSCDIILPSCQAESFCKSILSHFNHARDLFNYKRDRLIEENNGLDTNKDGLMFPFFEDKLIVNIEQA